jgi:DNA-binding transcriptional LysR family regulator
MDRFEAIRTLLAAVDGGSLTAASRQLGMPLPTVSRNVSELEARLGTQLVIRTSRKLLLTDAGNAFVAAGRRVLEQLDEAERAAAGEYRRPRGDLLVTAPIMFGKLHVTPVVLAFLAAYPEVNVRAVLFDHVIDLVENHVDVAVRIGHLPDSGLVAARIGEIHWVICASPAYLSTHGTPVAADDLAQHDCIAFEGLQMVRTWPFGRGTDAKTVAIRPRFAANTAEAVIEAAIAGIGIARLTSYQAAGAIRQGRLVSLLRGHNPEPLPVHLVHTGPPLVPLKMRAFLDFAGPRLKAGLADIANI